MLGLKIGHHKVITILGEGGMGIVYKALDERLERFVAIKILNQQALNNPQFVERFKREAKNQAKLNHPNIVPVYGFTEENRVLGIVMEYVEGETLEHLINRKGRVGLIESINIIKQILDGAAYAHNKGFVHRDIKPSNIIIGNDGVVKIMDFGISKSLNETKGITRTGTKLGTILYMSPEQIKAMEPTNQSDIYSIGITFYEMLNGKNPFDLGTDYQIMEAHLKMNPPRLSTMVGNVGTDVDDIIAHALNKNTKKRYQSCEEFMADINKLLAKLQEPEIKIRAKTKIKTDSKSKEKVKSAESFPSAKTTFIDIAKKDGKLSKGKFYIFAFFFIIMFTGLVLFLYDAVSGIWKSSGDTKEEEIKSELESYKLNPGYIAKTKWRPVSTNTQNQLNSISFLNDTLGFACGLNGTLLKTVDGGNNWTNLLDTLNEFSKNSFYDIVFSHSFNGFIVGDKGALISFNPVTGEMNKVNTFATSSLFNIYFLKNSDIGFIVGAEGTILKTKDGGLNWDKIKSPSFNLLYQVFFVDNKNGFIAGWEGIILSTTDQGETWKLHEKITDQYLRSISFVNNELGYAVGGGGEIYRTNNSGEDWKSIKSGIFNGLYKIQFFDKLSGIILGSKGEILVTEDAGDSWKITSSGQYAALTDLTVAPTKKIFITGYNGLILTSSN